MPFCPNSSELSKNNARNITYMAVLIFRVPCKIVFSPNLFVMQKILSSEYRIYACGKIFRMPRY